MIWVDRLYLKMNALVGAVDSFAPAHSASGLPVYVAASRRAPFTEPPRLIVVNRPSRVRQAFCLIAFREHRTSMSNLFGVTE